MSALITFSVFVLYVHAVTYVETYFNEEFVIKYDIPGSYTLRPNDYKKAPTLMISVYGAGGGAGIPFMRIVDHMMYRSQCTGQNGGYLNALIDTRHGTYSFNIIVGKGGYGGKHNGTCGKNGISTWNINATNGGDSSVITNNNKLFAISKGGIRSDNYYTPMACPSRYVRDKGGYTNISYTHGTHILERQNGINSYSGDWFVDHNITKLGPGYGGRGAYPDGPNYPCAAQYYPLISGAGNNGLVRIVPMAVTIDMFLNSDDFSQVDIDFFINHTIAKTEYPTTHLVIPTIAPLTTNTYLGLSTSSIIFITVIATIILFSTMLVILIFAITIVGNRNRPTHNPENGFGVL